MAIPNAIGICDLLRRLVCHSTAPPSVAGLLETAATAPRTGGGAALGPGGEAVHFWKKRCNDCILSARFSKRSRLPRTHFDRLARGHQCKDQTSICRTHYLLVTSLCW